MDFTLSRYKEILESFKKEEYSFSTFKNYIKNGPQGPTVILRHDVDRSPKKALDIAQIEKSMDIQSSYYFRISKKVFRPNIIKEIVNLGHEIGYHYEDLKFAKGDVESAISLFQKHLEKIRSFYPVSTISMHGDPLTKFDNKLIWEKYNYRDYGIIAELYLDIDYSKVIYITDTGRRWNDYTVNIRDRVNGLRTGPIKSSKEILKVIKKEPINDVVILNTHANRWHNNLILWTSDLIFQSLKNRVKSSIIRITKNKKAF